MAGVIDFQDFVLARRRSLLRTAWLLTGDWHSAEDLVQTALARCYPHWQRIAADNPDAYVRRAMLNVHASWWRRRWHGEIPTSTMPEGQTNTDEYAAADQRRVVVAALRSLPARQRATIVLRFFDDLSEAETATALGCSTGTVKSQTAKALATLRANGVLLSAVEGQEVTT
jgi:RNA polymerase sigma-70 factor (sigma-E family)